MLESIKQPLLSMTEAMKNARAAPQSKASQDHKLRILANVTCSQLKIFLEAYLKAFQLQHEVIPEKYGSLVPDLLNFKTLNAEKTVIIMDSDSLGIGMSMRAQMLGSSNVAGEENTARNTLLQALKQLIQETNHPIFIQPVDVSGWYYTSEPAYKYSHRQAEWQCILAELIQMCEIRKYVWFLPPSNELKYSCTVDQMWYLQYGEPFKSQNASILAQSIATHIAMFEQRHDPNFPVKKLLITDLDNTFWAGILGDDGLDGVKFDESKAGLIHLIYQKMLLQLCAEGVILAVVSKNDPALVENAFQTLKLICPQSRFAIIRANWGKKSENIAKLCQDLNLLPESAVFIDDNDFELQEVEAEISKISCLKFPRSLEQLESFLGLLRSCFMRVDMATNVEQRIQSYQNRAPSNGPSLQENDARYSEYLKSLEMELKFAVVDNSTRDRVFELINKTNQFNLNGRRVTISQFDKAMQTGEVWALSIKDRSHDFGVIGAAIVEFNTKSQATITSGVLSCRVFSRGIERAIFEELYHHLRDSGYDDIYLDYIPTERNGPLKQILNRPELETGDGVKISLDPSILAGIKYLGSTTFNHPEKG